MQPHRSRYWLTPKPDERFGEKARDICETYAQAQARDKEGEKTLSMDEMTGVQALERAAPDLPMEPGKPVRREFEYIRHGTQTLIAAFDVATGKVIASVGATRTEEDYAQFLENVIGAAPQIKRWHIVADNLNTHLSESVVKLTARLSGVEEKSLGEKGKSGVLASLKTREAFLRDCTHKVVFHFTPRHASWLNQVEVWFSILVKKVIRRGNFLSQEDLKAKMLAFIEYFNATMAKAFRWTYKGTPLVAES